MDLQAHNSLIRYLVGQGHTVFCMSWRNPGPEDRDLSFDAYRTAGVLPAIAAASAICAGAPVHVAGYCLGGTIAAITAAAMARDCDPRLASLTLLAAQTDFSEAGELMTFVDESQVALLEDMMWAQGVLTAAQMAAAFNAMRADERIWGRAMRAYALGEREAPGDLAFWNADQTRMPARMHSEYLRALFLENRLSAGRFAVEGRVVALSDIAAPIFAVGTEQDHVAPWRSVYKAALFTHGDFTFVLASGGHNTGIVAPPSEPRALYKVGRRAAHARYIDPDRFTAAAQTKIGSWWQEWDAWLGAGREAKLCPPPLGSALLGYPALAAAPGDYVRMR
jgi:polyhydroxyalkanoate synthase